MAQQALIFYGGWEGHSPEAVAKRFAESLKARDFEVELREGVEFLDDDARAREVDLIIPCITMAKLSAAQESMLSQAVQEGVGIAGAHGAGDAFRGALTYAHIMGGQFVSHPYVGEYTVRVTQPENPLVQEMPESFAYNSEQYYLHVDPGNEVLMETDYEFEGKMINMPVAWTKTWGQGNVFYCALGHKPEEYDAHPHVWEFIIKGALWAARKPAERKLTKVFD